MSIFDTVTIEQFKQYFFRDFSYLPLWDSLKTYYIGEIVYVESEDKFYKSLVDFNNDDPTNSEKWKLTKASKLDYVTDEDIQKAMSQAYINANERFGRDCNEKITIYLHLIAYYLVVDWKNAAGGAASGYSGFTASKSVGDVSESYNFPTWLMDTPMYSIYSSNGYGLKYLSLILPYISCTLILADGRSTFN